MVDEWVVKSKGNAAIDWVKKDPRLTTGNQSEWSVKKKGKMNKNSWMRVGYQVLGGGIAGAIPPYDPVTTPVKIGLGSAIAGQLYDLERPEQEEPLGERLLGAAEDFMFDVISPIALSKGIYGGKKILKAMVDIPMQSMFKPAPIGDYLKYGLKPTAGLATKSKSVMMAEQALGDFPLSAGPMQKVAQYNAKQLKFASEYLAREYGDILTKEEVGTLLKPASKQAVRKLDAVYDKLFSRIGAEVPAVEVNNTRAMLETLRGEAVEGPSTGILPIAEDIIEKADVADGVIPWEALKKHRTKIGGMMKEPSLISTRDIQSGDLKRLYGAITKDMEEAALKAGPKSHARWRAANKYFESSLMKKVPVLEEILRKGYDEEVYNVLMKSSKAGGSRLRALRKQMTPEQWGDVAGTVFGKLGEGTPGAQSAVGDIFSVNTFLTNWNKLAPEAKRALWGGTRYADLYSEINKFAHIVGDFKDIERLANRSRTASVMAFLGVFQSLGALGGLAIGGMEGAMKGVAYAGGATVLPYSAAKLITNQAFVKWLSRGVWIAKTQPQQMAVHIGRLFILSERENIEDEIMSVFRRIPEQ